MSASNKYAFVTGGTGFIGINLIRLLVEEGWKVTALHRSGSNLSRLKDLPIEFREGSITDLDSLRSAIPEQTEVVFHLAGDTNLWSKRNDRQTAVNVGGTENMVKAAAEKEVSVFIHTSSVSAWGDMSGTITEESPQKGGDSWVNYERTKWLSERKALEGLEKGMKVVILNPASVIGPYDANNWGRLFFGLRDGKLPGIPGGSTSIAHVRQVVEAHLAAVEKGRSGERYILGGENSNFVEFVKAIAAASGVSKIPFVIPDFAFKAFGHISAAIASITGKEPDVTPELAKLMTRKNVSFSSEKAKKELGYSIPPMQKSVNDCYDWLKKEQLL